MDRIEAVRIAARRLARWLGLILAVALAALLAERLGYAGLYTEGATPAVARATGLQLMLGAPGVAYLTGLWMLRRAVEGVARGDGFGRSVTGGLRGLGIALILGALLSMFVVPLAHWATAQPRLRSIDLDIATFVIGAIGLALLLVARLLEHADRIRGELAEFL